MKNQSRRLFPFVLASFFTVALVLSALFSSAELPTGPPPGLINNPALARARLDAWYNKHIAHPACLNCYKVDNGLPGIFERVPGTDHIISRDIPDPAPLGKREIRPDRHPETGEPLWYIGRQAYVGPTDEALVSASLPRPLIEVKRIMSRHQDRLFKIEGVHGVGIGEKGLVVYILPKKSANRRLLPTMAEGVPVHVVESRIARGQSHTLKYRPVPVAAEFTSTASYSTGTLGPHVSRDFSDGIGYCCQLYTLTAGHVVQFPGFPNSNVNGQRVIHQPAGSPYGYVAYMFQMMPCVGGIFNGCSSNYPIPINDVRVRPDAAAIGHDGADLFPMTSPCNGAAKPVRRMQDGQSSWKSGPSGTIRIPTLSNCGSSWLSATKCLRIWGIHSHRTPAYLLYVNYFGDIGYELPDNTLRVFRVGPIDAIRTDTATQPGDSGAMIAWEGTRDNVGLHIAASPFVLTETLAFYERLDYIKTAFYNIGASFDHYWGTAGPASRPSTSPVDNPC
jgi:hypothetical protein